VPAPATPTNHPARNAGPFVLRTRRNQHRYAGDDRQRANDDANRCREQIADCLTRLLPSPRARSQLPWPPSASGARVQETCPSRGARTHSGYAASGRQAQLPVGCVDRSVWRRSFKPALVIAALVVVFGWLLPRCIDYEQV
jgi:hypothetical protein